MTWKNVQTIKYIKCVQAVIISPNSSKKAWYTLGKPKRWMKRKSVSIRKIELLKKAQTKMMLELTNSINQIKVQVASLTSRVKQKIKDGQQSKGTGSFRHRL